MNITEDIMKLSEDAFKKQEQLHKMQLETK